MEAIKTFMTRKYNLWFCQPTTNQYPVVVMFVQSLVYMCTGTVVLAVVSPSIKHHTYCSSLSNVYTMPYTCSSSALSTDNIYRSIDAAAVDL